MATTTQRSSIQTPYGTISATPEQKRAFESRSTAYEGRTPKQQQALLAKVRQNAANLAAQQTQAMKTFAESRVRGFAPQPALQGMFGQPLVGLFPQSSEAIAQREVKNAPVLASTGFGEMQGSIGQSPALRGPLSQYQPSFGSGLPFGAKSPLYSSTGIGGLIAGGPQPSSRFGTSPAATGYASSQPQQQKQFGGLGPSGYDLYNQQQSARSNQANRQLSSGFGSPYSFPTSTAIGLSSEDKPASLRDITRDEYGNLKRPSMQDIALLRSRKAVEARDKLEEYRGNILKSGGAVKEYFVALPDGMPAIAGYNY